MNPIQYSLQQCRFEIPPEILEYVFVTRQDKERRYKPTPISIDAKIRELVIEPRVLVDCNLVGGTEVAIPLANCPKEVIDPFQAIYRIPKNLTNGRTITRALSVSFGEGAIVGMSNLQPTYGNNLLDAAAGVLNSHLAIPQVSTANCQLIDENTVLIMDNFAIPMNAYLRCWLENDSNFNHIQPTSYDAFATLVILAVKAYIYNTMQIHMDRALIHAGGELGRFKEIVDEYSDANEMYRTHLRQVWRRVAYLNDFQAHRRHLQRLMGGPN